MISASLKNWLTLDFVTRRDFVGTGLGLAAIACISVRPVLVKLAYVELQDPITILAMRMAYCWPIALVLLLVSGRQMQQTSPAALTIREKSLLVLMGFSGFYVSSYLDFWSLEFLSAGTSRLITYSYPSFVMVFSILILRRWPTISEVGALIITYAGFLALLVGGASVAGPEAATFDKHFMEWSPEEDALRIAADLVNDPSMPIDTGQVAQRDGWEPRRMNPALTYLLARKLIVDYQVLASQYNSIRVVKTEPHAAS
ncbi:DMT family transporter [Bradyrhizobium sp. Leo170]|uniref:DMT family transporter n=2 Tax=unclassified Bradyrhizobium TaxID=2631580 RepID=UPI0024BFDA63|nr:MULTISPECIES: DMT family transporter [unclassified Bradyrhizobium]